MYNAKIVYKNSSADIVACKEKISNMQKAELIVGIMSCVL